MADPVTDTALLLGLKPLSILGAAAGSLISLSFFDGQSMRVKWTGVAGGCSLSMLVGEPIAALLGIPPKAEILIVVLVALFGMSIVTAIAREIKWADVFWAILGKFGVNRPPKDDQGDKP